MPWDYPDTEYQKQAAKDPRWRLERLINYGLQGEKIDRATLERYLPYLRIPADDAEWPEEWKTTYYKAYPVRDRARPVREFLRGRSLSQRDSAYDTRLSNRARAFSAAVACGDLPLTGLARPKGLWGGLSLTGPTRGCLIVPRSVDS